MMEKYRLLLINFVAGFRGISHVRTLSKDALMESQFDLLCEATFEKEGIENSYMLKRSNSTNGILIAPSFRLTEQARIALSKNKNVDGLTRELSKIATKILGNHFNKVSKEFGNLRLG